LRQNTIRQLKDYQKTEKIQNVENLRSYILIVVDLKIAFLEEIV
jgi:hypothetical protein